MDDPVSDSARAAAERLSAELGPRLIADVEAALHAQKQAPRPEQYFDPVSLGALIVAAATLGWTVYRDLRQRTPNPAPDLVARTVRVELRESDATDPTQRDRIVDVVVSETVRTAEQGG